MSTKSEYGEILCTTYGVQSHFTVFLLQNLLFFVIYAVLLQGRSGHYLHAFAWRKLSQNCSCEEKMTNIRYVFEESRRVQHLIVSTQGNTGTHKDVPL